MYTVRLYYNTGFNSINIPDSPAILNTMTYREFPALDLLQAREISEISIRATYDQVKDADYCALIGSDSSVFYAVDGAGIKMTSSDVAVLPLIIDYLTTAGGVSSLEILDGITERHHVALADDTFGAYAEDDPYLVASKPLEIVESGSFPALSGDNYVLAQSTSLLTQMGYAKDEPIAKKCVQYEAGAEVASVTIPDVAPLSRTDYSKTQMTSPSGLIGKDYTPGMALFILDDGNANSTVGKYSNDGIAVLQSMGCADAIKNCYSIPKEYVDAMTLFSDPVEKADGTSYNIQGNEREHIDTITGVGESVSLTTLPNLEFIYDSNVKNKRVLYGEMNRYGLIAKGTGNSVLFKPEEIYHTGDTSPVVDMYANPAPEGSPLFRFRYLHGTAGEPFMDSIEGAVWRNAPLIFTDKSGSALETTQLSASQNIARDRMQMGLLSRTTGDVLNSGMSAIKDWKTIPQNDYVSDATARLISAGIGVFEGADASQQNYVYTALSPYARRRHDFDQEMAMQDIALGMSQVIAPTVAFPRSSALRDYVGNNVFVYRYRPTATDLAKQDKILTMYGYKDTTPLTSAMFTNRSKFNYIKASGVSVKTSMPRWINDGIAGMFRIGIRIWHVAPNSACYTDGTNV